jgi:putative transposase
MRDVVILFVHLIVTFIRLARPGGIRSVLAESALVKHQLLILDRSRRRAPNLRALDRIIAGICTLLMRPARVIRSAVIFKPSTLLHFHNILVKRKYRLLFSPKRRRKPGPKGPQEELIKAIVEMKLSFAKNKPGRFVIMHHAPSRLLLVLSNAHEPITA